MPVASSVARLRPGDDLLPDTNVWYFATTPAAQDHQLAADTIAAVTTAGVRLWTTRQVMREYYSTLTKQTRHAAALTAAEAEANVQAILRQCRLVEDGAGVFVELMRLVVATPVHGKQVHDANIVATMRVHGVANLLTHNTQDFTRFAHLVTVLSLVP